MDEHQQKIEKDIDKINSEWIEGEHLNRGDLFVIGCSTSEVLGKHIGTSGSEDVAQLIYQAMQKLQKEKGVHLAFQCCEHLNRALVVERETFVNRNLEEVSVVPVPKAGGSMASYAYQHMSDPVVVEFITANAGMDIGETMIGMHIKHVAVPLRLTQRFIGDARVTAAITRPKLIGGTRAKYE